VATGSDEKVAGVGGGEERAMGEAEVPFGEAGGTGEEGG
jgi:hypothetical protein